MLTALKKDYATSCSCCCCCRGNPLACCFNCSHWCLPAISCPPLIEVAVSSYSETFGRCWLPSKKTTLRPVCAAAIVEEFHLPVVLIVQTICEKKNDCKKRLKKKQKTNKQKNKQTKRLQDEVNFKESNGATVTGCGSDMQACYEVKPRPQACC